MLIQETTWEVEGIQFTESRQRLSTHCWCGSESYIAYMDHLVLGIDCVTYDWVFGHQSGWYETWHANNDLCARLHYVQIMCTLHDYWSSSDFWLNTMHFQIDLQPTRQPSVLCSFQFEYQLAETWMGSFSPACWCIQKQAGIWVGCLMFNVKINTKITS